MIELYCSNGNQNQKSICSKNSRSICMTIKNHTLTLSITISLYLFPQVKVQVLNKWLLTSSSEYDIASKLWPTWQLTKWKEPPAASIISRASFIRNWSNKWPLRETCQSYSAIMVIRLTIKQQDRQWIIILKLMNAPMCCICSC